MAEQLPIRLTKKQKLILDFLNSRPNKTGTLDDILRHVPGVHTYQNSKNYLSQTISRMRKRNLVDRVGRGTYRSMVP